MSVWRRLRQQHHQRSLQVANETNASAIPVCDPQSVVKNPYLVACENHCDYSFCKPEMPPDEQQLYKMCRAQECAFFLFNVQSNNKDECRIKTGYNTLLYQDVLNRKPLKCDQPLANDTTNNSTIANATAAPTTSLPVAPSPPAATVNNAQSVNSSNSAVTISIVVTAGVVLGLVLAVFVYRRERDKRNKQKAATHDHPTVESAGTAYQGYSTGRSNRTRTGEDTSGWTDPVFANHRIALDAIKIHEKIGGGAFGDVYRGTCYDQQVAIKRLKEEFRKSNKQLQAFVREARLVAAMDQHPNIVQFIGIAGVNMSKMMVVFEFMSGGDLRSLLQHYKRHSLPTGFDKPRLRIAFDIANGLTFLHSLNPKVLHRDLKSHNVLLNDRLQAKLTDFGISREESNSTLTAGMGTMKWMAPEVMNGERYDEKADIFSFGVMLSELDTLALPYANFRDENGRRLNEPTLIQRISSGTITVEFTETQLDELVQLAKQCVSFDPELRPTAIEVSYRLQKVLKTKGWK